MTNKEVSKLKPGQFVRSPEGHLFVTVSNFEQTPTVVRTVNITNPREWTLTGKLLGYITDLRCGNVVRSVASGELFLITTMVSGSNGDRATGMVTQEIDFSNQTRWQLVTRTSRRKKTV